MGQPENAAVRRLLDDSAGKITFDEASAFLPGQGYAVTPKQFAAVKGLWRKETPLVRHGGHSWHDLQYALGVLLNEQKGNLTFEQAVPRLKLAGLRVTRRQFTFAKEEYLRRRRPRGRPPSERTKAIRSLLAGTLDRAGNPLHGEGEITYSDAEPRL
jgi:hypothetical protein